MTDPSRSAAGVLARIHVNPEGGAPKHRVAQAELTTDGVVGDRQRDLRHHGGPTRAVCLFSLERIEALAAEGHPIAPGTTGENLTVAGLDWGRFAPGVALRVGDVQLELTDFAPPCKTIVDSFAGGEFKRIAEKVNPGWSRIYARVVRPGVVREGDVVELADAATRDAAVEDATPDAPGPDASGDGSRGDLPRAELAEPVDREDRDALEAPAVDEPDHLRGSRARRRTASLRSRR